MTTLRPGLFAWMCLPLFTVSLAVAADETAPATVAALQDKAAKFQEVLTVPPFEPSPADVEKSVTDTIATANAGLDKIGKQDLGDVAFATTVGALDDVNYPVNSLANRLNLVQQTSPDPALRQAAEDGAKKLQDWTVGIDYRADVYAAITAYAKTEPKLAGEEARLLTETLRDYRRAGLALAPADQAKVEGWRKELATQSTDFEANITKSVARVAFSRAQLDGVPDDFLASPKIKTGDDQYTIAANETYQYGLVVENAKNEETRKRLYVARFSRLNDKNVPLFNGLLELRNHIALALGYKSWADFQTEIKMAKTGAAAEKFIDDLIAGTRPKFDAELAEMQRLKAADTGDPHAVVDVWDGEYYLNQILKTRYSVDTEQLRVFFPFQKVLEGMFRIYEHDFGLKFTPVQAPYKWVPDLQLYAASDAASGEPMGLFYLDMFPREGKYNHFAMFPIIDGKLLPDGTYQRPTCCLVCNFPPPGADGKPALMTHDDVVTVFHEFGHALHAMLTRARFGRFAGTNVPGDFVESPSQMLENWAWDKTVLDSFAADYRDPSKKIPADVLAKLREAKLATAGMHYRRQFSYGKFDLVLHGPHPADQPYDCVGVSNAIMDEVYLPVDPHTAMIASFGHLAGGYDAGYYGYAWAEAIAADMATVFRQSPGGFMDAGAGIKLRTEIYQQGDSRDVSESIEKFLGRKQSFRPFLANNLGLKLEVEDGHPNDWVPYQGTGPVPPAVK